MAPNQLYDWSVKFPEIIDLIESGITVIAACRMADVKATAFYQHCNRDKTGESLRKLESAREIGAMALLDRAIDHVDTSIDSESDKDRASLKIRQTSASFDAKMKFLQSVNPRFMPKAGIQHSGGVTVAIVAPSEIADPVAWAQTYGAPSASDSDDED